AWCDVIKEKGLNENLDILMHVADAVAFAHSRGIIHRDLKPDNVMLGDYGEVLVLDWGLAAGVGKKVKAASLNAQSPVAGTPAYMPPEMAAGEYAKISFASDIYLLGAILYKIVSGNPPHTGKSFLECIVNAAANRVQETPKIGELLTIALKAMATEPAERYADVKEFQSALRQYQVHSESLSLANQAEKEFDDARIKEDYTTFNGCVFLFRQALKLWDGNQFARQGLKIAQLTYAKYALKNGDLDLAHDLLAQADFLDSALGRKIKDLKQTRDLEREAGQREWKLVFQEDFYDPAAVKERWRIEGADHWEVKNGQLHTAGGAPMLAIIKRPFWGDIRVTFECRQESDYLNDVSAVIGGYHFKYGGWSNIASGILATDDTILAEKKHSPLERSHVYRAAFEKIGNKLRMIIDDNMVFDVVDENIGRHEMTAWISRSPDEVALFGWKADTWYSQVKVYMLGAPRKEDLLDTAERLLQGNREATAHDLFEEVILGTNDPARLERAKLGMRKAEESIKSWENLMEARKNSNKVRQVLTDTFPENTFDVRATSRGVAIVFHKGVLDKKIGIGPSIINEVRCNNMRLERLEFIAGMKLGRLCCDKNQLNSLAGIEGMPLKELWCDYNMLCDLEPLRGMHSLTILGCCGNTISSIDPLATLTLNRLSVNNNNIFSLDALKGSPVQYLFCESNRIADIAPLAGMRTEFLWLGRNKISDLSPLKDGHHEDLKIDRNDLESLADLTALPIRYLYCGDNRISDLSPLASCPLIALYCAGNAISSLGALQGKNLEQLNCSRNPLETLGPFIDNPPEEFLFDCDTIPDKELEKAIAAWSIHPKCAHHATRARILLAIRRGEIGQLQESGARLQGHIYRYIAKDVTWPEAKQLCDNLGGRLAAIATVEQQNMLLSMVPPSRHWLWHWCGGGNDSYRLNPWIGLEIKNGGIRWTAAGPVLLQSCLDPNWWFWREERKGILDVTDRNVKTLPADEHRPFIIEWDE
ncbi:MAG: protein kinase, partial [Chitinivibrionales bacterium]|nr:protein kinase [Chitinivibrionales bacterium]